MFLLRLSPAFPFNLLNYALGLTRVRFADYLRRERSACCPGTLLYVYLGNVAGDVASARGRRGGAARLRLLAVLGARPRRDGGRHVRTSRASRAGRCARRRASDDGASCLRLGAFADDEANRRLVANVHPPDWANPTPAGRYNLVVLGAGTAGLVTAAGAAGLGARVALDRAPPDGRRLPERRLRAVEGGDPRGAAASTPRAPPPRSASGPAPGAEPDFGAAMDRMRRIRARHQPRRLGRPLPREFGVDVYLGEARFTGPDTARGRRARAALPAAVIATGARAAAPPIPGLAEAGYLTNETVFALTERPRAARA